MLAIAFPQPVEPQLPLGSLIYDSAPSGNIAAVGQIDNSTFVLDETPYVYMGPSDNIALDQPRVAVQVLVDEAGTMIVGPTFFNTFLLDTGSNSVLAFGQALADMKGPPYPYTTEGTFEEEGIAGTEQFGISAAYRFDFAGTSGVRNTVLDARLLSSEEDISMFGPWGIVGMPAMAGRVTSLDMTVWTRDEFAYMEVDFSDEVPPPNGDRFSVPVDNRLTWDPEPNVTSGDYPPVWADVPFLTGIIVQNGVAQEGTFLLDTGAQLCVMPVNMAMGMGLDSNGDDLLDENDDNFARYETVGGIGGQLTAPVFLFDEFHVSTEQGADLVWTDLQWLVLDIAGGQFGVFGADLLTSGWIEPYFGLSDEPGYFEQVHFDFTDFALHPTCGGPGEQNGLIHFDLNPNVSQVTDPTVPGAMIVETDRYTMVTESGMQDTYQVVLTQQPAADVTITLSNPAGEVTTVDDAHPANDFLVFTNINWNVPQTVRVTAVNDGELEGFHRSSVFHTSSSADLDYQDVDIRRVLTNIVDLDSAGVMLLESDDSTDVAEGGDTDTYQVVLTGQPSGDVTIELRNSYGQVTAVDAENPGNNFLVFTPFNWDTPRTVRVTAVDDAMSEGPHQTRISHRIDTADFDYQMTYVFPEVVNITDNDGATVDDFYGTPQDDVIEFHTDGTNHTIKINSVSYPSTATRVNIYALDGYDTLRTYLSSGDETVDLAPGSADVAGASYDAHGASVEEVRIYGGGGSDEAYLAGSSGNDCFHSYEIYSYMQGGGVYNYVWGFDYVEADLSVTGGGGTNDRAYLYDSAAAADDTFYGYPDYGLMSRAGPAADAKAIGFDVIKGLATGGGANDEAYLYGSDGDDRLNSYETYSYLHGTGYYNFAWGFDYVEIDVNPGGLTSADRAWMFDSAAAVDDTFYGEPGESRMVFNTGKQNKAIGFDIVRAYATGGGSNDEAYLTGSAGQDRFISYETCGWMYGPGYWNLARGFDYVKADATTGSEVSYDRAWLYDSDAPADDTFYGDVGDSRMDRGSDTVIDTWAVAFDCVRASAYGGGADDRAYLTGFSGNDRFYGYQTHSYMTGPGYYTLSVGFHHVEADVTGSGGSDRADLYDTVPSDDHFIGHSTVNYGELTYEGGTHIRAEGFGVGLAWATGVLDADEDMAELYTGTLWQAIGDWESTDYPTSGGAGVPGSNLQFARWITDWKNAGETSGNDGDVREINLASLDYLFGRFGGG